MTIRHTTQLLCFFGGVLFVYLFVCFSRISSAFLFLGVIVKIFQNYSLKPVFQLHLQLLLNSHAAGWFSESSASIASLCSSHQPKTHPLVRLKCQSVKF